MYSLDIHIVNFSADTLKKCKLEASQIGDINGVGVYRIVGGLPNIRVFIRYLWARVTYVEADNILKRVREVANG